MAERITEIRGGLAVFDGFEGGEDFGFRLFECARLGGFAGGDFDEMPAEFGADERGLVGF